MKSNSGMKFIPIFLLYTLEISRKSQAIPGPCNQPPSQEYLDIVSSCNAELGKVTAWECRHVCVLKKTEVIETDSQSKQVKVNAKKWPDLLNKIYPPEVVKKIGNKLRICGRLYSPDSQNNRCDENDEFYRCYTDITDAACRV